MRAIIDEGWDHVKQPWINERINSMPERLQAVLDGHGAMTGY